MLKSGHRPEDLQVVFNLLQGYQHGQSEMGALVSLVDGGSLLMASGPFPYWFRGRLRTPQDESRFFVRRYWGGSLGAPADRISIDTWSDARGATIVGLGYRDASGWQVELERRIFLVKNRFLLVRDRLTAPRDMALGAGPIWHARDLAPERGSHYFDLYTRQPLSNVWRLRNPPRHALVYFVPRAATRTAAREVEAYLPPADCPRDAEPSVSAGCRAGPPFAATQSWAGELAAGDSRWFDTLIVPHAPERGPRALAEGVRVLAATDAVALEVAMGDELWLVVDNPSGAALELPTLSTDARYAIARTSPGLEPYLLTSEASRLRWRDVSADWPVVTSVERGGELVPQRLAGW